MTLTYRSVKGSALTATEFDGNTAEIAAVKDRVTTLESETLVSIDDITQAGPQMIIELSNSTTKSLTMPALDINDRGSWAAHRNYSVNDFFDDNNGGWFRVLLDHTSGDTFDEFANDGDGHNYYRRLVTSPANSFPGGGELGQVIMKLSATEQDKGWRFLPAIYVAFDPSSDSALTSDNVAEALEELESKIATALSTATAAIATALAGLDAADIGFSPSSASGLIASDVAAALDELAARDPASFAGLSGHISASQRDSTATAFGAVSGTVSLDPSLGDLFLITPTGNVTINATGSAPNAKITLIVQTSGTSSYNITFGSNFRSQGVLATGTASSKKFAVSFVGDSVDLVETGRSPAM